MGILPKLSIQCLHHQFLVVGITVPANKVAMVKVTPLPTHNKNGTPQVVLVS